MIGWLAIGPAVGGIIVLAAIVADRWRRAVDDAHTRGYATGWDRGFDAGHETGVGDVFRRAAEVARKQREREEGSR